MDQTTISANSTNSLNPLPSNAPLKRVSGRVWKEPKKPFNRDSVRRFGKGSWAQKMDKKNKEKMIKEYEKQLEDESLQKKKEQGEVLAARRLKKEAQVKEERLLASMTQKRYDRMKRREARKIKIANKKAEMHAES